MAKVHPVTLKLETQGFAGIKGIGQDFKKFSSTVAVTKPKLEQFIKGITKVHGNTKLSKVAFEGQISAIKKLRDNVGIGTKAYKRLGEELDKVTAKMNKALGVQQKSAGFFGKLGPGATAAIGGAGAYIGQSLGISPAISGLASAGAAAQASKAGTGLLSKAGLQGGLVGAGIGAGVTAIAGAASFGRESAEYASGIQKLQIALKGVTKNSDDFQYGLNVIATTSKKLNVPIAASTKQFTTLSASVLGAGGTIQQAEEVFTGVSNAIKATGGDAEDVQSAIRAMSQIFGKGKVSAEELQGQLGERLAGAVVKFAEANGSSLQKLQKDLRDGTVGLDQIMNFAKKLNLDFADTAEKVANSSADAGQRLKTTMDRLKLAVGTILQPIGAEFQRVFAAIVGAITDAIEAFNKFMGIGLENAIAKTKKNIESLRERVDRQREGSPMFRRLKRQLDIAEARLAELEGKDTAKPEAKGLGDLGTGKFDLAAEFKKVTEEAINLEKQVGKLAVTTTTKLADAFADFFVEGKRGFADLARSAVKELQKIIVRAAFMKYIANPVLGALGLNTPAPTPVAPSAKGNVFAKNKIVPYAYGGIVNRPTIFPMANGAGLMGEAGPEAIMPLKRGANGKLGVQATGGIGNIVVNVDATNSSVEGDEQGGRELGRLISAAIQSELIQQQRPGGLLA